MFSFGMFFRLFVIVGVIWILEFISHVATLHSFGDVWINIIDYIVSGQGIVVFVVTILRKEVLKNLYELWVISSINRVLIYIRFSTVCAERNQEGNRLQHWVKFLLMKCAWCRRIIYPLKDARWWLLKLLYTQYHYYKGISFIIACLCKRTIKITVKFLFHIIHLLVLCRTRYDV